MGLKNEGRNHNNDVSNKTILPHQKRINDILDSIFKLYSKSTTFKKRLSNATSGQERSVLLTVMKESLRGMDIHETATITMGKPDTIHFGARVTSDGRIEKYMPKNLNEFTVQCIIDQDTFLDICTGKDKYGQKFNIDYAFAAKEVVLIGEDWLLHKIILEEMFNEFRDLFSFKSLIFES